jgi:hypothetical protein
MNQAESWLRFASHIRVAGGRYDTEVKHIVLPSNAPFDDLGVEGEVRQGELHIEKEGLRVAFFWDRNEVYTSVRADTFRSDILVYDHGDGAPLFYEHETGQITRPSGSPDADHLIENARCFFRLVDLFKANSETGHERFNLVDYFSEEQQRLVLISSVDNRRAVLALPLAGIPTIGVTQSYKASLDAFATLVSEEGKYMGPFLKAAIITKLVDSTSEGWQVLLAGMDVIIKEARTNLNVFLYGLSLEKIKGEYRDYKKRYYDEISAITKTFAGQVVVLPVTMIGSIYAAKQLDDNVLGMSALLLGLILYLAYITVLIRGYSQDAIVIGGFSERDFERMRRNEFFKHESDEIEEFGRSHAWVKGKLGFLGLQLRFYYVIHLIVTAAMLYYGLDLIESLPSKPLYWVILLGAFCAGFLYAFPKPVDSIK